MNERERDVREGERTKDERMEWVFFVRERESAHRLREREVRVR